MKIETLLHEEIEAEFKELNKLEVGSDAYRIAVEGMSKLMDKAIEIDKLNIEQTEKENAREDENYFRLEEMKMNKKDQMIKNGLTFFGVLTPAIITIWGAKKAWKFEETGTIVSQTGRSFMSKLILPKK